MTLSSGNSPALRFPEFRGEWKEIFLRDAVKFENGKAHENEIVENGRFIVVNSKFIASGGSIKKYSDKQISPVFKTDVVMVMSDVPKGQALAKCFYIDKDNLYTLNQRICALRAIGYDSRFLYYLVDRNKYFLAFDSGVGQTNLRKDEVLDCPLIVPESKDEQNKIGSFLSAVDEKIGQLVTKKDLLFRYKKGVMQQIFDQKIRFIDSDDNEFPTWHEEKIGEICDVVKGEQLNGSELVVAGKYPMLNGGIEPSGFTDQWNTPANTITISEGGNSCGFVNIMKVRFFCGGHCYALKNIKPIVCQTFLYQALKFKEEEIMRLRVGSGLPNIQKKDLNRFSVPMPSLSEQKRIAQFLTALDEKTAMSNLQVDNMKAFKNGLLQQMFV